MKLHAVVLHVELVELVTGLWCRTCALSTGVQATVCVTGGATRGSLSSRRRCTECGGDDLEPVGP